jgi:hypothetical protein
MTLTIGHVDNIHSIRVMLNLNVSQIKTVSLNASVMLSVQTQMERHVHNNLRLGKDVMGLWVLTTFARPGLVSVTGVREQHRGQVDWGMSV